MSGKLVMCKGLPGSGKSTWAAKQVGSKDVRYTDGRVAPVVIVNKDDIRARLNKPWSYDLEKEVLRIRDFEIAQGLSKGYFVISSDTNLAPKHESTLLALAKKYKSEFAVQYFTDMPIDECIRLDAQREDLACVGEKVIRQMAEDYLEPSNLIIRTVAEGKPQLFLDLDGVFADFDGFIETHLGIVNNRENEDPDFWEKAKKYKGRLYFDMEPLRGARELYDALRDLNPIFLTGCPWSIPNAAPDKREWVAKHLDPKAQVICCKSRNKARYGKPGDVLLDDWAKYKHLWEAMGGKFLTYLGNVDASVKDVKEALNALKVNTLTQE